MTTRTSPTDSSLHPEPLGALRVPSPVGDLTIVASRAGVRAVLWPVDGEAARTGVDAVEGPNGEATDEVIIDVLDRAARQLEEYFAGDRRDFDLPLDPDGTAFQQRAWTALRSIGFGDTISYGEQAERMGDRNLARAVGAANGRNPISIIVPCHRVVGTDGSLTGFAGGVETKRWLLDHEARVAGVRLL